MRNRSTRAIVGLLLLAGIATSGLKQAGFLTGTVIQNARMQFRAASPYAEMGADGVLTVPSGSNILLDWSETNGSNSGDIICYLYASRAIDGIPAGKNNNFNIPSYGVREVNAITQDTSFTVMCDNGDGYSPPVTSQTVQVRVGSVSTDTSQPYDHRAIQYPALPVAATFTMTSGSTTNGADNVLDIQKGSDVVLSWTSSGTQDACTLQASDLVNVPTEIASGTLHSGNTYTGGKLNNIANDFFIVRSTGSMTLRGVTESFSVFLSCLTNSGMPQAVSLFRSVYVQPDPPAAVDIKINGQDGTVSVAPNTPVTVTWTSNSVTSCDTGTAPAPWGPNKPIATSGPQQYTPSPTQTHRLPCPSVGGSNPPPFLKMAVKRKLFLGWFFSGSLRAPNASLRRDIRRPAAKP